ncbi:hypothetical protein [Arenibacter sp. GZD-96]|uniref:hypothetical protein n=1 Tax=Aurantibrevibacter litoralis TaxID=3106030 RepID=UPI002AFF4B6E|nr:hypothetical protein [Arenibacter sp. GZD-96]
MKEAKLSVKNTMGYKHPNTIFINGKDRRRFLLMRHRVSLDGIGHRIRQTLEQTNNETNEKYIEK